jgi:hypothetical protein
MVGHVLDSRLPSATDEVRRKVDHNDAVTTRVFANQLEDVVRHVPADVVQRTERRVAPHDWGRAELDRLARGRVRDVANVDDNPKAVHLADESATDGGEPVVDGLDGLKDAGRVRERVVARVGERHVANTEGGVLAKNSERVAELVSAVEEAVQRMR